MVDNSHYWVDDSDSQYYNRFVSINNVKSDWSSAEHIIDYGNVYNYCLALDYNVECVSGKGSAIFLHCSNGVATAGCVAIPEKHMIEVLKNINGNCVIIIDSPDKIKNY